MKLTEVTRTGWGDPEEDFEPHSRSSADVAVKISFAHERGNEEAFTQLQNLSAFKAALEQEFLASYRALAQRFISQSQIRPGYGWMDDLECELSIAVGPPKAID